MTTEAKAKYSAEAKDLLEKYKNELKQWRKDVNTAGCYNFTKSYKYELETDKHEK